MTNEVADAMNKTTPDDLPSQFQRLYGHWLTDLLEGVPVMDDEGAVVGCHEPVCLERAEAMALEWTLDTMLKVGAL